jgi:hypothetical protein
LRRRLKFSGWVLRSSEGNLLEVEEVEVAAARARSLREEEGERLEERREARADLGGESLARAKMTCTRLTRIWRRAERRERSTT